MERIRQKIGRIKEYTTTISSIQDRCLERFQSDKIYRGALLHYLYLLTDTCISLVEMVIKYKNLRAPQSYSEAIDILGENEILDPTFAYDFARIASFRNFLAHDYEKMNADFICEEILPKLDDIKTYIQQIENSLK